MRRALVLGALLAACRAPSGAVEAPVQLPIRPVAAPAAPARPAGMCAGAATLLGGLKRPMRIEVYATRGLPALDRFAAHLEAVLAEYNAAARGNLEVSFLDGSDPAVKGRAALAGLHEHDFFAEGEALPESEQHKAGFLGLTVAYGSANGKVDWYDAKTADGLEVWIVDTMREVRDKGDGVLHRIGVLVGHGEPRFDDTSLAPAAISRGPASMQAVLTGDHSPYRLVDVDTKAGAQPIDPTLEALFVLQPARDLSDPELRRIDDFVLAGKSVAFVASAVNVKAGDAKLHATIDRHRLDTLLAGYGFDLHADTVLDFGDSFSAAPSPTSNVRLAFPWTPRFHHDVTLAAEANPLDTTHPIFLRLQSVTLPLASSVSIVRSRQPDATFRVLARTTAETTLDRAHEQDLAPSKAWAPPGASQQVAIAAVALGTMKSAFGGGKGRRPSRVLVLASASAFANPFVVAGRGGEDAVLEWIGKRYAWEEMSDGYLALKDTIDWMVGEDELSDCSRPLAPSSKR